MMPMDSSNVFLAGRGGPVPMPLSQKTLVVNLVNTEWPLPAIAK